MPRRTMTHTCSTAAAGLISRQPEIRAQVTAREGTSEFVSNAASAARQQRKDFTLSDWIGEITRLWGQGGANTLELARMVRLVRSRMPRGEWTALWRSGRLPFSKRKAEMLVAIGERWSWADAQTFAHLPTGWSILYQLAHLERATFEELLRQGVIHPRLKLWQARKLVAQRSEERRVGEEGRS